MLFIYRIKQGMNFLAYSCFSCDFLSLNTVLSKSIIAKHVSIYLFKLVLVFTTSKEISTIIFALSVYVHKASNTNIITSEYLDSCSCHMSKS